MCVVGGRGSQRAWWGHLGPGHLGAQGASVVRVVGCCHEQTRPNPTEKEQTTTCSRPCSGPGFVPRRAPRGVVLCRRCSALVWRCLEAQGGVSGRSRCSSSPLALGSGSVPGRAGMAPWAAGSSSRGSAGCALLPEPSGGSARPGPARPVDAAPWQQQGPGYRPWISSCLRIKYSVV